MSEWLKTFIFHYDVSHIQRQKTKRFMLWPHHSKQSVLSNLRNIHCQQGALWSDWENTLGELNNSVFQHSVEAQRGDTVARTWMLLHHPWGSPSNPAHISWITTRVFAQKRICSWLLHCFSGPPEAASVVQKPFRNLCVWEAESGDPDFRP